MYYSNLKLVYIQCNQIQATRHIGIRLNLNWAQNKACEPVVLFSAFNIRIWNVWLF